MAKLIVFEGISGSGKSHLIDAIVSINKQCETVKWFDNELTIDHSVDLCIVAAYNISTVNSTVLSTERGAL